MTLKHRLSYHEKRVTALHFVPIPTSPLSSSSRTVLLSGSEDRTVKGVDVEDGLLRWSFEGHQGPMYVILFSELTY